MPEETVQAGGSGGLLDHDGIAAQKRTQEDLATLSRAVRKGWNVPLEMREAIKKRLTAIVEKESVVVMTKFGPESVEAPADANAVKAAAVVLSMTSQDQSDDHLADKNKRLDDGKATERIDGLVMEVVGPRRTSET